MRLEKLTSIYAKEYKMMKKLQKIIKKKMNISKILDMKVIQSLKIFERIEKKFETIF